MHSTRKSRSRIVLAGLVLLCVAVSRSAPAGDVVPAGETATRRMSLLDLRTKALATDQILLEYAVGRDSTIVSLVAQDRTRSVTIAAREDSIEVLVEALRSALRAGEDPPPSSSRLHAILMAAPLQDIPPEARLVLVANGPLARLSFAALHDGHSYLIERHALSYVLSTAALDPAMRHRRPRPAAARMGLAVGGDSPAEAEEAQRTSKRFARATFLAGHAATEAAVKENLRAATHAHFATRDALASGALPGGLLLAPGDDPAEDGRLEVNDVLALSLDADLVVLSVGGAHPSTRARDEGMQSLAQAFLHAGTGAVVMSLEPVDRPAARWMDRMYEGLLEGRLPPDIALQRAQVAALRAGQPARDWASFVALGRMRAPRSDGKFPAWPVLAGFAVAAGILALAFRSAARAPK